MTGIKIETGEAPTSSRVFNRLRDVKLCLDLDCSATWGDSILICPACGGREVALIETYINRKEEKAS